jgi:hypothetical protein
VVSLFFYNGETMDYKSFEKKFLNAVGNYFHSYKTPEKVGAKKKVMQRINRYANKENLIKSLTFSNVVVPMAAGSANMKTPQAIRRHLNKKSDDMKNVGPQTLKTEKANVKTDAGE